MLARRLISRCAISAIVCACMGGVLALSMGESAAHAQDKKKKEKNPLEGKKGVAIGTLTAKGPNFIEVKADGEEKGRRYVPHWVGGLPSKGGGPDKKIVKVISTLKVGSRIEVQWEFEERLRILHVKVLKAPHDKKEKDKTKDAKRVGRTLGVLESRVDGKWIEVKGDGEEKARKYYVHAKLPDKLLKSVRTAPIGSRVAVDWLYTNHGPIVQNLEVLAQGRKQ